MLARGVCAVHSVRALSSTAALCVRRGKHPRMFPVRVVASDGSTFTIASTLPMTTLKLHDDRFSHPEFTEGKEVSDAKRGGRIGKFISRYQSFDIDNNAAADDSAAQ